LEIPFQEVAELLVPLLSTGAGAAVESIGARAGERTLSEAEQLARGLRDRLGGGDGEPAAADVETALREAVASGDVDGQALVRIAGDMSIQAGHSVFVGSTFHTKSFRA
jgi:hypothetical protein